MNKILKLTAPILFLACIVSTNTNAQSDTNSEVEKEKIEMPESFPTNDNGDHEKYDKEKKEWIEKHPEEYLKMGGNPNPKSNVESKIKTETTPQGIDRDKEDNSTNEIPKNGTFWNFQKATASSSSINVKKSDIQFAQDEMNDDLLDKGFMIVMNETEFLANHGNTQTLFEYEIKDKELILSPKKNCKSCTNRIFEIKEQTSTSLILVMPYDDNEDIVIQLHFKQVSQP